MLRLFKQMRNDEKNVKFLKNTLKIKAINEILNMLCK